MKHKEHFPVYGALLTGVVGFILRLWLEKAAVDSRGLIHTGHISALLLLGVSLVFFAFVAAVFFRTEKIVLCRPGANGGVYACGCAVAAVGLCLLGVLPVWEKAVVLGGTAKIAALGAGLCFGVSAVFQLVKKEVPFYLTALPVIFFMMYPLSQHSQWGQQTQFLEYGFALFACISVIVFSYRFCAARLMPASWRGLQAWGLGAIYLCLVSAVSSHWAYFLAMAAWVGASLCHLRRFSAPPMEIPENVATCLHLLEKAGCPGYLVGGCVRDHLLGIKPHDYDLCTAAKPEKLREIFKDYDLVCSGEKHGTIGVIFGKEVVEITTFRTEGQYSDSRHPDKVAFVDNLDYDLARRDFTVNAIAYNPKTGYQDPFGGMADLQNRVLRTVGAPQGRFTEDALRILRGMRFALRFRLQIENRTYEAMVQLRQNMDNLAPERVFGELSKILPLMEAKDLQVFAPILTQVIPELALCVGFCQHSPHHAYDVYTHTACVVEGVPQDLALRWAALLHDTGKPVVFRLDENGRGHFYGHAKESAAIADSVLCRLKAPTALREEVVFLVLHHMDLWENDKGILCRRLGKYGVETARKLLLLQKADFSGKGVDGAVSETDFSAIEETISQILAEKACLHIADLAVDGNDLITLGFAPGPSMGACLQALLEKVIDGEAPNEAQALKDLAKTYL